MCYPLAASGPHRLPCETKLLFSLAILCSTPLTCPDSSLWQLQSRIPELLSTGFKLQAQAHRISPPGWTPIIPSLQPCPTGVASPIVAQPWRTTWRAVTRWWRSWGVSRNFFLTCHLGCHVLTRCFSLFTRWQFWHCLQSNWQGQWWNCRNQTCMHPSVQMKGKMNILLGTANWPRLLHLDRLRVQRRRYPGNPARDFCPGYLRQRIRYTI